MSEKRGPALQGSDPQAPPPLARDQRRVAVGRAGPDRDQRLGDPTGDELVAARRMRPLVEPDVALARLARVVPGLLARAAPR